MRHVIHVDNKPIVLVYEDFEGDVNVNELTKIDYSNLYGEAVTISTLLNRLGQLRAEAERVYEEKKLERSIMEADLVKRWRREASNNTGKFTITEDDGSTISIKLTERAIDSLVVADKGYQVCKRNEISAQRDLGYLDSLYWATQSKDKKLGHLLPAVTPKDFWEEIVDGTVNGIYIKKVKR